MYHFLVPARISPRRDLLGTMNFSNDRFVRTTDSSHKAAASKLWETLQERG